MGFLKKFLVEEIEPEELVYEEQLDTYVDVVDVNTNNVTQENLITDIYNQNELSDLSKSIFKIGCEIFGFWRVLRIRTIW